MDNIAGQKSSLTWAVHISVVVLVALWLLPTLGLFVSSFRSADQIAETGWWKSLFSQEQNVVIRTEKPDQQQLINDLYVIDGNLFALDGAAQGEVSVWGTSSREISTYKAGETADLGEDGLLTVEANGDYRFQNDTEFTGSRGQRVFLTAQTPPSFSLDNYKLVLGKNSGTSSMAKAFFNTMTVSIPATIIPILIAAFAAYALAWMDFPGRALLVAFVVGLLVVPLQLALIPLLSFHGAVVEMTIAILGTPEPENLRRFASVNMLGSLLGYDPGDAVSAKGYLGVWMAHTGFGLPLAIYLLRNYMVGLPKDIIENARVDGATEFQIFVKIILPLSFPALASFAIFQFLWTWNDLLVALVFLIDSSGDTTVMTRQIVELLGSKGGNWEILATAAFVSISVPLFVFFAMQKYLVRGLLAGSVK
ncbi:carbohydrate ABC transporter permease [Pacificibacter marinus]|uniref:L-arabinose transport system permease protein AraQ n=2 Tax=Pacificibacter TaxID=1042323 RepID=A0A1Y5SZY1_9RHOB|nr:carbohydrate ABC transporter permease [Pacificibacter marinus]SEK83985.1 maltose ABC transporter membrane protein /trehalose ABC transporter membrane protein /sucrose ABC transporter membrane protein [Pacificibacter marinus]SLN48868.1 L-arabinose transport system permease protein AraQ [Pacificibacter marinus]